METTDDDSPLVWLIPDNIFRRVDILPKIEKSSNLKRL